MKANVEPLEGNKVKLSVEVEEHELDKAVDAALRKIASEIRIPGFRPGKAPRRLLEARMGKAGIRQEALREALPDFYAEALRSTEVDAIAPPEIDVTGGEVEGPILFDAVVEVRPRLNVVGYQGLRVTIPRPDVTDEELDRQIDRLREPFGELQAADRPVQERDHVTLDLRAERAGETLEDVSDSMYQVGSGSYGEELDNRLVGANTGDVLEFDSEIGVGDPIAFRVVVKDVKEMILPEVTDEWAGEASEFETVQELRDDIATRMRSVKQVQGSMAIRDGVIKELVSLVDEDAPEALVGPEMERRLHDLAHRLESQGANLEQYLAATGQPGEQLLEDLRGTATEAVKADLALRSVAETEGFEVTEEDVDAEIAQLAEQMGQDALSIRTQLEHADQMQAVRSDIRKAKALGWLLEHVEIVDEDGKPIDRADLQPAPPADAPADNESESQPAGTTEGDES